MGEQQQILDETIGQWMATENARTTHEPQLDDILVVGFKLTGNRS
jgi:hypothetical protein